MVAGTAAVHAIGDDFGARAEAAAWARFVDPGDDAAFCDAWLTLLASRVDRARGALLLLAEGDGGAGSFGVAAVWPDAQRDLRHLGPVAQRALTERAGVVVGADGGRPAPDGAAHVGYPVEVAGELVGAVVLDVAGGGSLQAVLRQLHWASAWLLEHFGRRRLAQREAEVSRLALLNEVMATALQHERLQASALAVANELATRLGCDRVCVGFERGGQVALLAISRTATFDARSDLVRTLGEAMDEVLDAGESVAVPAAAGDDASLGALAHAQAARSLHVDAMLSVPLPLPGRTLGVITLERSGGPAFDAAERRTTEAVGAMLAPVWSRQQQLERPWWRRAGAGVRDAAAWTLGPRHPGVKLIVVAAALALAAAALVPGDDRVAARTTIEGSTQLAAVAPFDGFIAAGLVRAGDTVRAGQPMARLDDRDLLLERAKWSAEREQQQRKFQVAMAQADRGTMGVIGAQIAQSQTQLALVQERLARATLAAPFDGVVVSGDLSQSIGAPVEQGKVLFEVAPLTGYRVVLQVDDRDIARVAIGQRGELVLSSQPDRSLAFTVSAITPVAAQVDGRNVFRVEARVDGAPERLRPGMEGIGKIVAGRRSLLWIWTHGFVDWLRLALWSWLP